MLAILVLLLSVDTGCTDDGKTLLMSHSVYRHGARSPIKFYKNNPYQESSWPDGSGRLTQYGMRLEYGLGKYLKNRYMVQNKLVNTSYLHKQVYIRSSDVDRCLQSAESQLAGLYPPKGRQVWTTAMPWQPIPVHTVPKDQDPVLRPDNDGCPRLKEILAAKKKSPAYKKFGQDHQVLLDTLSNKTGMEITLDNIWIVNDDLNCEEAQKFTLPDWSIPLRNEIRFVSDWVFLNEFQGDDEIGRLLGGTLLGMINNNMIKYTSGKQSDELFQLNIFSGHDTSVLSLAAALDIDLIYSPPYATCLMVELYINTEGKYFVELNYRNDTSGSTYPFKLKNCDIRCPLDKFIQETKNRIPTDRNKECGFKSDDDSLFTMKHLKVLTWVFFGTTLLFLIIIIVMVARRSFQKKRLLEYRDDEAEGLINS